MNNLLGRRLQCVPQSPIPIMWNMTSSTKAEVHNILQCRQRSAITRPGKTFTENFVNFHNVVFEICERTNWKTDTYRHADRNNSQSRPSRGWSNVLNNLWPRYLHLHRVIQTCMYIATSSKNKVTGQSWRSQDEMFLFSPWMHGMRWRVHYQPPDSSIKRAYTISLLFGDYFVLKFSELK